jgi:hypothetical protein
MVRRYAHPAPAQMAKNAAVIDALLHVTTPPQRHLQDQQKRGYGTRNPLIVKNKCW